MEVSASYTQYKSSTYEDGNKVGRTHGQREGATLSHGLKVVVV